MRRPAPFLAALLALASCAQPVRPPAAVPTLAPANALPDAATMPAARTVGINLASAPGLSRLAAAALAGGRTAALAGPGPLTLLAPSDAAWARLPPAAADALLRPENRALLARVLDYHLLRGRVSAAEFAARVRDAGGRAELLTVEGEVIAVTRTPGGALALTDAQGSTAYLEVADLPQANGLVHVVNGVLVPGTR